MEIFNIEKSEEDQKWYIAPLSITSNGKYLIQCDTEEAAQKIKTIISLDSLRPITPLGHLDRFNKVGFVQKTPVFVFKG